MADKIESYSQPVRDSLIKAIEFQQYIYELSSDWNYYEHDQHEYLQKNIKYAIFGAQDSDKKSFEEENERTIVDMVYNGILKASRTKNCLYVGTIFNVLCNMNRKKSFVSPVPIFKVKRCHNNQESSTKGMTNSSGKNRIGTTALYTYCVHYVDVEGRIYKNWTDYVRNNTLPKCLMVLPMGGLYQDNPNNISTAEKSHVWVEIGLSPAATSITPIVDGVNTLLGLGALGVGIATLASSAVLAGPVILGGTVCGLVSGGLTTARCSQQLIDRSKHKQSISVTDRSARSAWFGIAGSVLAGAASGSTALLNKAIRTGTTLGTIPKTVYNSITIGNLVANGIGIGNGAYGIFMNYKDNRQISVLEVAQIMTHVLFFGNAVMNFQTARTIINNTQQNVLQDYEQSLRSNRHRKAFNRIRRNTQASSSDSVAGDTEIIRGIRSITNKDDFFQGVVRNRKVFNAAKAEVTFKDGCAMINNNLEFNPIDLSLQPMDVKVNVVSTAKPFNTSRTVLGSPNKMPIDTFFSQVKRMIINVNARINIPVSGGVVIKSIELVGRYIIEMREFSEGERTDIIVILAKIALRVVQHTRKVVTDSMEELMSFIWDNWVKPRVAADLKKLNMNLSDHISSELVGISYMSTLTAVNAIFDNIEDFLNEIIVAWTQSALSNKCSICSRHVLVDLQSDA